LGLAPVCLASQLLLGGKNLDLARAWRERMFGLHPELREEFEEEAATYIEGRRPQ
jgi:hypothetical protein